MNADQPCNCQIPSPRSSDHSFHHHILKYLHQIFSDTPCSSKCHKVSPATKKLLPSIFLMCNIQSTSQLDVRTTIPGDSPDTQGKAHTPSQQCNAQNQEKGVRISKATPSIFQFICRDSSSELVLKMFPLFNPNPLSHQCLHSMSYIFCCHAYTPLFQVLLPYCSLNPSFSVFYLNSSPLNDRSTMSPIKTFV